MPRSPRSGVLAATLAGLIWGLAFLIPVLLDRWSPVAVTVGRYLAYGLVSLLLVAAGGAAMRRIARRHAGVALQFALTGNVAYYLLLVLGIAWAGGPVTDIIIGCIPIAVAVGGNMISHTYRWSSLILPVVLVCAGLAIVNAVATGSAAVTARPPGVFALGVLCSFAAVGLWTWYGLANAAFVQRHPEVGGGAWSAVVGLGTGLVTLLALPLAAATGQLAIPREDGDQALSTVVGFVIGSIVLGVVVSWVATMLWNSASARLSTTAAGMLINVETVSGYTYLYAAARHWPPAGELMGFALILLGVILVVRLPTASEAAVHP
jgi:drug/metabolite transporter (DMT)-like permease